MNNIIKRNGTEHPFETGKIKRALEKANTSVTQSDKLTKKQIEEICNTVADRCNAYTRSVHVEEIQDMVVQAIMEQKAYVLANNYIVYRYEHQLKRRANTTDDAILSLIACENEEVKQENSNKNPLVVSVQRDYMAGEVSKDLARRILLPKDIMEAHDEGVLHFHDSDYYAQKMHNCCLINIKDMLENGTVISGTMIEPPKSFRVACNVTTQIIAQVASAQYGGQTITLSHLAPFIEVSRQKIRKRISQIVGLTKKQIDELVHEELIKEIKDGIQTIQYQVITLMTTNGQAPFITVCMYLNEVPEGQTRDDLAMIIEEMLKMRMQGVKNEKGVYITPAFPKLIYVLQEDNIHEGDKYWYLTELAAKCTAKRMVPDYVSEKIMMQSKVDANGEGHCYPPMGCRSFLTPYIDENGNPKYYGRFNQGVVTINLVDVACSSEGNFDEFWKILDERLELCHRALRCRHERLKGTTTAASPIHWQYGALARLPKGEKIDRLLYGGYSTLSLGYAGLYEMCMRMYGKSHTDPEVRPFALSVMQKLNDKCNEWKQAENIDYSVYGTPLESTTYKFAKCLQKRFGKIKDVTDHNYITNSYHVCVREDIDAFTKLKFESEFQKLSPGGAISYIEMPNMQNNIPAVLDIIKFIYDNIMYAELNTKSDYCMKCDYDGEIRIVEDEHGKLVWECPNCGNRDQSKMSVARRTCGYIGTQFWNQGRTQEIRDRKMHL